MVLLSLKIIVHCPFVCEVGLWIIKHEQVVISETDFPLQGLNFPTFFFLRLFTQDFSMLEFSSGREEELAKLLRLSFAPF